MPPDSVLQEEIELDILACLSVGDFGLLGVTSAEHVQLLKAAAVSPQCGATSVVASPCCMAPVSQKICNEPKASEQAGGCQPWHPLAMEPSNGEQACCLCLPVAAAASPAVAPTNLASWVTGPPVTCMPASLQRGLTPFALICGGLCVGQSEPQAAPDRQGFRGLEGGVFEVLMRASWASTIAAKARAQGVQGSAAGAPAKDREKARLASAAAVAAAQPPQTLDRAREHQLLDNLFPAPRTWGGVQSQSAAGRLGRSCQDPSRREQAVEHAMPHSVACRAEKSEASQMGLRPFSLWQRAALSPGSGKPDFNLTAAIRQRKPMPPVGPMRGVSCAAAPLSAPEFGPRHVLCSPKQNEVDQTAVRHLPPQEHTQPDALTTFVQSSWAPAKRLRVQALQQELHAAQKMVDNLKAMIAEAATCSD